MDLVWIFIFGTRLVVSNADLDCRVKSFSKGSPAGQERWCGWLRLNKGRTRLNTADEIPSKGNTGDSCLLAIDDQCDGVNS